MANKKIPMRKCVGCQEMKEKKSLIRVVKTAEGDIILDDTGKKNGRGAYICKSLECFKKAKKTKALERSLGVSVLSMLGLAAKSGNVVSGEFSTEKAVKTGKAFLVIVADDSSDNTKKHFSDMTAFYEVPIYFYSDKVGLGNAIGKEFRASLAVTDENLANAVIKKLQSNKTE